MARTDPKTTEPGTIADTVAHLGVWARHAPRGLARVEFHSEYARAEADRRLGETLHQENIPYHQIKLPVRRSPSEVVRTLRESLARLEPGVVSITGFATACPDDSRALFLGALSLNRENIAEHNLRQIWWMTSGFTGAFIHTVPDLASWFLVRLRLNEEFSPPTESPYRLKPPRDEGPGSRLDEGLRRAASLVERFRRAKEAGTRPSELIQLAGWAADAIVEVGAPRQARELADQLVEGAIGVFQNSVSEDLSSLRSLNSLARLLYTQGRIKDAEPIIQRVLSIAERSDGQDRPEVAVDLNNLASLLRELTRFTEAEPLLRRALAIWEQNRGPEHPDVASALNNLALLLQATGRLDQAEQLLRRALAIWEQNVGPAHPSVASALDNLAALLTETNRLSEAEPLLRRALAIGEGTYGPDHPDVAIRLNNLALVLQETDRLDEAEPLFRRALAIDEEKNGPDHPKVAIRLSNLAGLLLDAGRLDQAEPLLRRALTISEQSLGPAHPIVAPTLNNLAGLLQHSSRLAEAEPLYRRAMEILLIITRSTRREHPQLRITRENYAGLLAAMGQSPEQIRARLDEIGRPFGMSLGD